MLRHLRPQHVKANQEFGNVSYVGAAKTFPPYVSVIVYGDGGFAETRYEHGQTPVIPEPSDDRVVWVRVVGVHDIGVIKSVGEAIDMPATLMEDIADTTQRPKYEEFGDAMFMVLKIIDMDKAQESLTAEQVSMAMDGAAVVTFQENAANVWDSYLDRLRKGRHLGKSDPHYLMLALLDVIVDRYMITLGKLGDKAEMLEELLFEAQTEETLSEFYNLKRETAYLRKYIWPLREVLQALSHKKHSKKVSDYAKSYLREIVDHVKMVVETVDTLNQIATSMIDVYSSVADMRMNMVMKVLTVIGTIFLPLTFITSLYGMNFENMPELKWRYGYYGILGFMLALSVGMLAWFRKKKWL
ncbi:magnesium/cobalt transporter CorA [Solidesulfovibrio sp.]|uniref:magnesium/cobalt transporter CorA n=1 Tax=Solidesulfovibrio sp. TaxID=2910990 RepID=UPI00260FA242|nr:magnesium/cobalt transporter CorA [Solidesulfovibrio sp.]